MFKIPSTIDKLVHSFVQNLGFKMEPVNCTQSYKVNFVPSIHKAYKMKKEVLRITEETKDVFLQNSLDFSNIQSIQSFIEKQTIFLDKFIYTKNIPLLSPHLKNINNKMIQKIIKMKSQSDGKTKNNQLKGSAQSSLKKEPLSIEWNGIVTGDNNQFETRKLAQNGVPKTSQQIHLLSRKKAGNTTDTFRKKNIVANTNWTSKRKEYINTCSLTSGALQYAQRETEMNKKYLKLYIQNDDFVKKNIQIKLYISIKVLDNKFKTSEERKKKVLYLCKRSILSLIYPSKNAFVAFENNLDSVLQNCEAQGCKRHFSSLSSSTDCIYAVLVLSYWAELLVKHPNTTMIRTICYTLNCTPEKVVVLKQTQETPL